MTGKLIALAALFALCFSALAAPVSANPPAPSSSEAACDAAGGVFTAGTAVVDEGETIRTTTTVDSCVVTTVTSDRVNTGHKNFAVDFERTVVTEYTTTTVATENWEIVGWEPGELVVTGWACFNPADELFRGPWGSGEGSPATDAPSNVTNHPQCSAALAAYEDAAANGWYIAQTTDEGEPTPVYGWVSAGAPIVNNASSELSDTETAVGCFNLVSQKYLIDNGVYNFNNHCQKVLDAR